MPWLLEPERAEPSVNVWELLNNVPYVFDGPVYGSRGGRTLRMQQEQAMEYATRAVYYTTASASTASTSNTDVVVGSGWSLA